ncbi:MAG TPA: cobyric acid synthase [Syntrophorhabdaceae bacterium]|jgi:adenosylcobyric acid synthase
MAKALMVQGTGSGAGKSLIAAALLRIFRDKGLSVAPYKSQNMALNSYVTMEGGEIGRAQALQAEAARIEPSVHMNPVLLKASGEMGSQVVLQGKVHSTMKATEYYAFRKEAWEAARDSYSRLSKAYDIIVIEGAGSPAEINLMDVDIVNMAMARHAKAPVILVGDIDKGGVFASLYGTVKLVGKNRRWIKAFVINKFRGDVEILRPGLDMITKKTGVPVIGVLPYVSDLGLPEEDGMALSQSPKYRTGISAAPIRVVVVRLRYISNFTDFDPFYHEPDVEISFSASGSDIENADLVIIPGTKNTMKDLAYMRQLGLDGSVRKARDKGAMVMGMCGGYQMLGRKIHDPGCVESDCVETDGLGLLDLDTLFGPEKRTRRVEATPAGTGWGQKGLGPLSGYEIHMGESVGEVGLFRVKALSRGGNPGRDIEEYADGSRKGNCWGTYIHGIFDNDRFRRDMLDTVRRMRGLEPLQSCIDYGAAREKGIDNLARMVEENMDIPFIEELLHL